MKIAVTYENGQVFQHFGHTRQFKLYTAENGAIVSEEIVDTAGSGHGALSGFLKGHGVDALICGGIGMGAQNALKAAGIRYYGGVTGSADEAAKALATGSLQFDHAVTITIMITGTAMTAVITTTMIMGTAAVSTVRRSTAITAAPTSTAAQATELHLHESSGNVRSFIMCR